MGFIKSKDGGRELEVVEHDGRCRGIKRIVVVDGWERVMGGDVVGAVGVKWTRLAGDNFLAVMSCDTGA